MTRAVIWHKPDSVGIEVTGHAGYDDTGRDIVCAALSVLVQALANALYAMQADFSWAQGEGMCRVNIRMGGNEKLDAKTSGAFAVAESGIRMLATAYPKHVTIEE